MVSLAVQEARLVLAQNQALQKSRALQAKANSEADREEELVSDIEKAKTDLDSRTIQAAKSNQDFIKLIKLEKGEYSKSGSSIELHKPALQEFAKYLEAKGYKLDIYVPSLRTPPSHPFAFPELRGYFADKD